MLFILRCTHACNLDAEHPTYRTSLCRKCRPISKTISKLPSKTNFSCAFASIFLVGALRNGIGLRRKMPEREEDHLTAATRLLEKRREMNEVEQALNAHKEARKRLESRKKKDRDHSVPPVGVPNENGESSPTTRGARTKGIPAEELPTQIRQVSQGERLETRASFEKGDSRAGAKTREDKRNRDVSTVAAGGVVPVRTCLYRPI